MWRKKEEMEKFTIEPESSIEPNDCRQLFESLATSNSKLKVLSPLDKISKIEFFFLKNHSPNVLNAFSANWAIWLFGYLAIGFGFGLVLVLV